MSTWTDEKHNDARVAAQWPETPHGIQEILSEALDEIARLHAESARRMVWLETAQRAHEQTHAALMDMTEHAAHPAITDDMVERAAAAHKAHSQTMHPRENHEYAACAECGWAFGWQGPTNPPGAQRVHEHAMRAALEAALNPGEEQ